ncbi:MAG: integrin alpha, partial [candidate division KSB1 bacterium]|nr:integrin alpha [candidate division KSB1 bacterium]
MKPQRLYFMTMAAVLIGLNWAILARSEEPFALHQRQTTQALGNWVPSASFLGMMDWERVGYYMNNAGDVNGDGCEDFLIGTFHNRENGYDAGAAYLILGHFSNIWGYKRRLEYADARFLGKDSYDAFGYYVAGNGDVNGDGYDDFLIGAPAGNEAGGPKPGHAFLFLGRPNATWGYDCVAQDQADASFVGRHSYDHLGESVAMIGDLNGDGLDDFIIGAPFNDDGTSDGGKIYLFLGKRSGWKRNIDVETAAASFLGNRYNGWAGYIVSAAGDANGDGVPDFLISSFHQDDVGGRVYLIFGRRQVNWGANFSLNNADVIFEGEKSYDRAGWSLAPAGDVNHDGLADFLIGAIDNKDQAGKVYLILGKATAWPTRINLAAADASWQGERYEDQAGWSVSGLPDVNYDHCDEILIGAWHNDHSGANAGKAYLIYGRKSGWQQNVPLQNVPDYFLGEYNGDYAGYCVAGNDANGDGLGDLWVSASYNSDYRYRSGKIYAFLSERTHAAIAGQIRYAGRTFPVPQVRIAYGSDGEDSLVTDSSGNFQAVVPGHQNLWLIPSKLRGEDFDPNIIIAYD